MFRVLRAFFRYYRQLAVIASLVLATFLCLGLFVLRVAYSHSFTYRGLVWNLFLAWLPLMSALVAYNLYKKHLRLGWLMICGCALVWLVFLPNAPYLVTDMMHLQPQPDVPFWYDLILFVAFAWTGVLLGLVSLFLMQEIIRKIFGTLVSWLFALGVLGLSSFGIYLGRFLRWNSWDLVFNPMQLLADVLERMRHPLAHFQTFVFSVLFAFFFISVYLIFVAVTQFGQETQQS